MNKANSNIKVVTIVGTRPEVIRLSRTMSLLDEYVSHIIVHTGQNYDYELNEIFFKDLEIRKPDYFLNANTSSLGKMLGETIIKIEDVFIKEKPTAVLILGDTNSSIAALMAKRMKIPIYHMEAGNRCFDFNVPEEINRRIIDHISDFNLVYTEHARRNLLREGLPYRRIYLTGSPMREVLEHYSEKINNCPILQKLDLKNQEYFVVSVHREENVDNPDHLKKIVSLLNEIAKVYNLPVIVSTHPRTRKRLKANQFLKLDNRIKFLKPFGFFDYVNLQKNSFCVLSDSGTISEESAILAFPAITIRNAMERQEAMDAGTIMLTGLDMNVVIESINVVINERKFLKERQIPIEYTFTNTSWRVVKLIMGTAKLSNVWSGIIKF